MPTYEYKCFACGNTFERFQSITAEPIKKCPECGKVKVRRLMGTGSGLIFKGSGFYTTDYKGAENSAGSSSNGTASKEGSSESKPETKSESSSESKSESKSDAKPQSKPDTKTEKAS